MYQKEIIYMGLHKDGSRIGNAGFLKVENRERESSLDLKLRNIPYNIRGRFPIRIYNGNDWKEINGVSVQEGSGSWKEDTEGMMEKIQIQIMLPGGYFLEGKSKNAPESVSWTRTYEKNNVEAAERGRDKEASIDKEDKETLTDKQDNEVSADKKGIETLMGKKDNEVSTNKKDKETSMDKQDKEAATDKKDKETSTYEKDNEAVTDKKENQRNREPIESGEPVMANSSENITDDIYLNKYENSNQNTSYMYQRTSQKIPQRTSRSVMEEDSQNRDGGYGRSIRGNKNEKRQTIIVTEELQRPNLATPRPAGFDLAADSSTAYSLKEDKWEQILDNYEKIHPYDDERVYVKLEPKDFIILQAKYQCLVNNSFLLHGFYNYRYVILGKEQDYYLGVPGVFYEREKMVALMFGFEAFECPGGIAKAGEFGYYLRKVEI